MVELPVDSELSLCGVFPLRGDSTGSQRERYCGKALVCKKYTQKVPGNLKHGAGIIVTHQWELSKPGGEILEL